MAEHRRGSAAALGLFTIIPAPYVPEIDAALARRALMALPWLGLTLGAVAAGVASLINAAGAGTLLASMLALATVAGLTGAMHLDGLADTADGLGSRRPPEEALQIMRRSDIGPMGVASIVLVLLVDAAALDSPALSTPTRAAVVALFPLVGRVGVVMAALRGLPGARTSGFGALFTGVVRATDAVVTVLASVGVAVGLGWLTGGAGTAAALGVGAAVALAASAAWRRHLMRRLGGLTGDTFGSIIEVTQAVYVVVATAGVGLLG